MATRLDEPDPEGTAPEGVELRILEDDRRRSAEFLREFLASNRVGTPDVAGDDEVTRERER